jgi:small-conductance mechanosensitive channel
MLFRLLLASILGIIALAQDAGAPVYFEGREILRIYAGVGPYSAQDRARDITARLQSIAERGDTRLVTTTYIPAQNATAIATSHSLIMMVIDADATMAGKTEAQVAEEYARAVRAALLTYREKHTLLSYLTSSGKALAAWVVFAAFVWLVRRFVLWFRARVDNWVARRAETNQARGVARLLWERGAMLLFTGARAFLWIFALFQFSFLLSYSFGLFPQTAGISTTLLDYLRTTFGGIGKAIVDYLPSGGFVIVVGFITRYLLRLLAFIAKAVEQGDLPVAGMHPEMARPTYQLVRIFVLIFALVVVFPYLPGGQSEAFKGVSILLGLLISIGSGTSIGNVLAGIMLTYMRPYRIGDRVKIADTLGDVLEKNLLVTRVRTIKNVEVVVPNSSILGNQILNYSAMARNRGLVLHTTITIGYSTPWHQVHDLMISAAKRTGAILADPAPYVLQTSLNDYHISYELNAFTDRPNVFEFTYSALHQNLQDTFAEAGVEIMSPGFLAVRKGPAQLPVSIDPTA